ncbi:hypothetical protein D5086_024594 [Populus alba]|uniref:Uncharacterized protein n=1 Tax=Populus alba TaxID=43335 RepID=A0ACC4B6R8_POPAL
MEIWLLVLISLSLCVFLKALFNHVFLSQTHSLPPAPFTFPVIGNILWIRKSTSELERAIRSLNQKLGPMVTLHMGSRPAIFIADRSLAYIALIQKGAVFANRPPASATSRGLGNQHNINSSFYGPTWRLLRRNLTSEILHPSRVKTFGHALLMCFGDKLEEKQIQEIEQVQRRMVVNINTVVGGFLVPKNGTVNFMVADIGWDSKAWEDPMAFKPERFLNSEREAFDITGSREIKMMPFGAGRRICPGYGLAMLHLEYFVANLVLNFEWKAVDGDDIDLYASLGKPGRARVLSFLEGRIVGNFTCQSTGVMESNKAELKALGINYVAEY